MKRLIGPSEAKRVLSRVPESVSFWLCTNQKLFSLKELALVLKGINDDMFRYHVNRDKNDFENWISDIIQDKELAREISRIKTKETLMRKIQERVEMLSKILKKGKKKKAAKRKKVKVKRLKRKIRKHKIKHRKKHKKIYHKKRRKRR